METRRVNVRGIILKDGKLFAQALKHGGGERDYWNTPGGGLDIGESIIDGLTREMIEETGVSPKIGRLLFIQQFNKQNTGHEGVKESMELFFHIENPDDYETVSLESTSHGTLEVSRCGFIDPRETNMLPAFLRTIDIESYIATVQPVFFYRELG